jgi:hypothetical protein
MNSEMIGAAANSCRGSNLWKWREELAAGFLRRRRAVDLFKKEPYCFTNDWIGFWGMSKSLNRLEGGDQKSDGCAPY